MSTAEKDVKGEFAKTSEETTKMAASAGKVDESQRKKAVKDTQPNSSEKDTKPELTAEKT